MRSYSNGGGGGGSACAGSAHSCEIVCEARRAQRGQRGREEARAALPQAHVHYRNLSGSRALSEVRQNERTGQMERVQTENRVRNR